MNNTYKLLISLGLFCSFAIAPFNFSQTEEKGDLKLVSCP